MKKLFQASLISLSCFAGYAQASVPPGGLELTYTNSVFSYHDISDVQNFDLERQSLDLSAEVFRVNAELSLIFEQKIDGGGYGSGLGLGLKFAPVIGQNSWFSDDHWDDAPYGEFYAYADAKYAATWGGHAGRDYHLSDLNLGLGLGFRLALSSTTDCSNDGLNCSSSANMLFIEAGVEGGASMLARGDGAEWFTNEGWQIRAGFRIDFQ